MPPKRKSVQFYFLPAIGAEKYLRPAKKSQIRAAIFFSIGVAAPKF
jgi:hypothetical protein